MTNRARKHARHQVEAHDANRDSCRRMQRGTDKPLRRAHAFSKQAACEVAHGREQRKQKDGDNFRHDQDLMRSYETYAWRLIGQNVALPTGRASRQSERLCILVRWE
jgi:hypothetical protein